MKKRWKKAGCALLAVMLLLTGCGAETKKEEKTTGVGKKKEAEHEALTLYAYNFLDYEAFLKELGKKYPEIRIELIPKNCNNNTHYAKDSAAHGDAADIVSGTIIWKEELQKESMLDLSGYNFTSRFNPSRLSMTTNEDGSLYLLPNCYKLYSSVYNKTMFEEHGWKVPASFEELKALVPAIEAAGIRPFSVNATLAGSAFQYVCDLGDTLNWQSREGEQWREAFLKGETPAKGFLDETITYLQEWMDLGAFPEEDLAQENSEVIRDNFYNGASAFYINSGMLKRYTQNEDGTGDEFALLPWLSPDGSNNYLISQNLVYHGLNKRLGEKGNEQKLEDGLKVMDFMSSVEGMTCLANGNPNLIFPLKDYVIEEDSLYYDVKDMIMEGQIAELIYEGWDDIIVDIGNKTREFLKGNCTKEELIDAFDEAKQAALASGVASSVYGNVEETLSEDLVEQLIGRAYCESTGADCFLVPERRYYPGIPQISEGVNILYDGPLTEQDISYVLPTSYYGSLFTLELTGKELRELEEAGFNKNSTGKICPYTLIAKEGFAVKDDETCTVVTGGFDDTVKEKYGDRIVDTGVVGMDAMKKLCLELENVNTENAVWK